MGGFVDKTDVIRTHYDMDLRKYDPVDIVRSYVDSDLSISTIEMDRGLGEVKISYVVDGITHFVHYDTGTVRTWRAAI